MTEIRFRCKHCQKRVACPEKFAGRSVNCPNCQNKLTVPAPEPKDEQHFDGEEEDGFGGSQKKGNEFGELDLTPMVDVTMLLLIFFILTARYIEQRTLPTPPPTAQKKDDNSGGGGSSSQVDFDEVAEASIVVTINERNNYLVDDIPVAPTELANKIRATRTADKSELVIDAHPSAIHDAVVQVIDIANEIGIQKIRLTSKSEDE